MMLMHPVYITFNQIMSGLYEDLCNLFVKPARQSYSDHDLGPVSMGKYGIRQNFTFTSRKGFQIKASFFNNKTNSNNSCIIYLHSFNGSRLQSLRYASDMIQKGFHFCSFDFAGCGNSGGEYVSLGWNERWDVLRLLENLKLRYQLSKYFIWGRSMGAVTAIKFYNLLLQEQRNDRFRDVVILGLILDSAFISLRQMAIQVGHNRLAVPEIIVKAILLMARSSIEERGGFNFEDIQLQNELDSIRCSVFLVASKEDTFVSSNHSEEIFAKLKIHDKEIQYARGQHYEARDAKLVGNIYAFCEKNLKKYQDHLQKFSSLRHSRTKHEVIYRFNDFSSQKPSKSLKKYQPKALLQKSPAHLNLAHQNDSNCTSNAKIMLYQSTAGGKASHHIQNQIIAYGSDKKISTIDYPEKQWQTEKRIEPPKIKFSITSIKTQKPIKNQQSRFNQPTNFEIPIIGQGEGEKIHESNANRENHCNVICDKLRKKGKNHREKLIQFKDRNEYDNHINKINFDNERSTTKIHFPLISLAITPSNLQKCELSPKRLSITAQQYKNHQISTIKDVVTSIKAVKVPTELKIRAESSQKYCGKVKSLTNLANFGYDGKHLNN